jgi:hypothetical protein
VPGGSTWGMQAGSMLARVGGEAPFFFLEEPLSPSSLSLENVEVLERSVPLVFRVD